MMIKRMWKAQHTALEPDYKHARVMGPDSGAGVSKTPYNVNQHGTKKIQHSNRRRQKEATLMLLS